jgi:hypothetical protein
MVYFVIQIRVLYIFGQQFAVHTGVLVVFD